MSLRMRVFNRAVASLAVVLLCVTCAAPHKFHTRLEREWSADQVSEVKLHGLNGRVDVQASHTGKVKLIADISATGRPARDAVEKGLVEARLDGDTLLIRERTISKKVIEVVPFFHTSKVKISYVLTVPESTDVAVSTLNGRISSAGVSGFLNLETVNGRITVTTPRGQLEAKTVNGSIRADFTEEFRGAQLRTVNGSIRLTVPPDASIDAQVDQVNGAFQTNIPVSVNTGPGHRESAGSINGGDFPLEVSTVNGSVSLQRIDVAETAATAELPELPEPPETPELPEPPAIPNR